MIEKLFMIKQFKTTLMALYIVTKPTKVFEWCDAEQATNKEFQWHIGNPKPILESLYKIEDITEIQADGHELEYIKTCFNFIPIALNTRVIHWYGDMAKFIAGNL